MSFPTYPDYVDSGVDWLGDVPAAWEVKPLRSQFSESKEKNADAENKNYLSLVAGRGIMPYAEKGDMGNKKPEDLSKCKIVEPDDFVINSMNFGIGAFGLSAYSGVCSPVYVILKANADAEIAFLKWLFEIPGFRTFAQSFGNGILAHRAAIGWDELKTMVTAIPTLAEQRAIAAFLDRETAKVDAGIAAQRRLIALLTEKRAATISHAVTKGLDPTAPTKASGIDWLGDIPAHWEVVRLRFLCKLNPSKNEVHNRNEDEEVSFVPMEAVGESGELDPSGLRAISAVLSGYTYFAENDVTMAKITPCFENGKGAIMRGLVGGIGFGTTELTVLRANALTSPDFLSLVVNTEIFRKLGEGAMYGAGGQKRVPDDFVRDFVVPLPPLPEQQTLVGDCHEKLSIFDKLLTQAHSAIALLTERRAALISAAVTGKIDIRGVVSEAELAA